MAELPAMQGYAAMREQDPAATVESVQSITGTLWLLLGGCGHWWQNPPTVIIGDWSDCPRCGRPAYVILDAWAERYPDKRWSQPPDPHPPAGELAHRDYPDGCV